MFTECFSWFPGDSASPADSAPQMSQQKRKKLTVNDVFNQDEVEEEEMAKRRKLVRLDYDDDQSQSSSIPDGPAPILNLPNRPTTAEEKRRCIKTLIERIPTGKEELFAYQLDWRMVDGVSGVWKLVWGVSVYQWQCKTYLTPVC